jgi:tetratricopeptide (TPR) repeat protein
MKPWPVLAVAILAVILLGGCRAPAAMPAPPPIAAGPLDTAQAYLARGDQYAAVKQYDRAIADYGEAIRLKADYAEAYNNRGLAHALSGKQELAQAVADYSRAIQLRPTYAYAYNNRGVAYMAGGHPAEALRDWDSAIRLQPDLAQAYSNRGNAYNRAGRLDLAIPDFIRAAAGQPGLGPILFGLPAVLAVLGLGLVYRAVRRPRSGR